MDRTTTPRLIPLPLAAQTIGRHEVTVRRDVAAGTIPAIKIGSRWYVNSDVLDRIVSGELVIGRVSQSDAPPPVLRT